MRSSAIVSDILWTPARMCFSVMWLDVDSAVHATQQNVWLSSDISVSVLSDSGMCTTHIIIHSGCAWASSSFLDTNVCTAVIKNLT